MIICKVSTEARTWPAIRQGMWHRDGIFIVDINLELFLHTFRSVKCGITSRANILSANILFIICSYFIYY